MYKALAGRARWARIVLIAAIAADVAAVVSDYLEYDLLGRSFTTSEANANDLRQGAIGIVQVLVYIAAIILFLSWFHRAYKNLEPLGAERRFGTGWAIGAWFVPFLSIWRPKQIANDIWRGSNPHAPLDRPPADDSVPPVVQWWWAAFLISSFVQNVAARLAFKGGDVASLQNSDVADIVGSVLDAGAAALAIVVIGAMTARQAARAERRHAAVT